MDRFYWLHSRWASVVTSPRQKPYASPDAGKNKNKIKTDILTRCKDFHRKDEASVDCRWISAICSGPSVTSDQKFPQLTAVSPTNSPLQNLQWKWTLPWRSRVEDIDRTWAQSPWFYYSSIGVCRGYYYSTELSELIGNLKIKENTQYVWELTRTSSQRPWGWR